MDKRHAISLQWHCDALLLMLLIFDVVVVVVIFVVVVEIKTLSSECGAG